MNLLRLLGLVCLGVLLASLTWAQERPSKETCPHIKGWKPTDEQLKQILSDHRLWAQKYRLSFLAGLPAPTEGRANLCNADLSAAEMNGADLTNAELNNANLMSAKLNGADMSEAELNNAFLFATELNNANLSRAELHESILAYAKLNNAILDSAKLNNADLRGAKLNSASLFIAKLNEADLNGAELHKANLGGVELNKAKLGGADLNYANLERASLKGAQLDRTSVAGAVLANADLSNALYAPVSQPPDSYVAGIKGLQTVIFPPGREDGLVQLRDLLQKAGLRDLEREATFAIESGKTKHAIAEGRMNPAYAAEGVFRIAAFDWTTRYGLHPARALLVIVALWVLLIPVYAWSIWHRPRRSTGTSGIYRTWPKDRIEVRDGSPMLDNPARVERLHGRGPAIVGWAAYFSLLSAFQIGFREFSVGTWLARTQPRNFVLEPTGWVRTVSGFQSLLSVYLLAIWALTYFGRPFQ
jgi:uncharacterized protein YjbI with pentapeptide repeats